LHGKKQSKLPIAPKDVIIIVVGVALISLIIIAKTYQGSSYEAGIWLYTRDFAQLQNSVIDKLLERNINTIYFSATNDKNGWDDPVKALQYANFIDYARSKGMKVFAVTLEDPLYVLMTEDELEDAFGNFINKTKHMFDTYVIDVEPHSIDLLYHDQYLAYKGNEKYYLEKYVQMSRTLRNIADQHKVKYIDTIPPSYHAKMIQAGIAGGVNALSSHSINVMAYANTIEGILDSTSKIRADSTKRLVINVKVTPDPHDPMLAGDEITRALKTLKQESLSIGIWYATDAINLDARLFQV
jgi:hypothetical protein